MKNILVERRLSEATRRRLVAQHVPAESGLFLASSLPVREVDMYADHKGKSVVVGANRRRERN